ncbi:hypothetical protein Droror1_Dr00024253 [Drosera rotundifolia]
MARSSRRATINDGEGLGDRSEGSSFFAPSTSSPPLLSSPIASSPIFTSRRPNAACQSLSPRPPPPRASSPHLLSSPTATSPTAIAASSQHAATSHSPCLHACRQQLPPIAADHSLCHEFLDCPIPSCVFRLSKYKRSRWTSERGSPSFGKASSLGILWTINSRRQSGSAVGLVRVLELVGQFCGDRQLEMLNHGKWKSVEWAIVLARWQVAERVLEKKEWVMCCCKVSDEVKLGIAAGEKRMVSLMLVPAAVAIDGGGIPSNGGDTRPTTATIIGVATTGRRATPPTIWVGGVTRRTAVGRAWIDSGRKGHH